MGIRCYICIGTRLNRFNSEEMEDVYKFITKCEQKIGNSEASNKILTIFRDPNKHTWLFIVNSR